MKTDDAESYGLIISFSGVDFGSDPEHAFVHGVEWGQLWQRMRSGTEAEIEQCFHTANRVLIERAAAADGWDVQITPTEFAEWINVKLAKQRAARQNPHGLRVVTNP